MNTVESMKKLWLINTMLAILGISACSEQTEPQANDDKIPEESLPVYPAPDRTTIPAFPGAEGAGKFTTGGAEGIVYVVTSSKMMVLKEHYVGLLRNPESVRLCLPWEEL